MLPWLHVIAIFCHSMIIFIFSDYYMKNSASDMTISSLVSPLLQTNNDLQCVEFNYKFTGHSMAHFTLTLYRDDQSESTKINLYSTDEWITYKYQSKKAFKFIVLNIEPFLVNYGKTELASVDYVTVTQGNCTLLGKLCISIKWYEWVYDLEESKAIWRSLNSTYYQEISGRGACKKTIINLIVIGNIWIYILESLGLTFEKVGD